MPTGYTAGILNGEITTFPQFAKQCMRNFGAMIHLRDEPLNKEYEPRIPSDYYNNNINLAKANLEKYNILSDCEIIEMVKLELEESKTYHLTAIETNKHNLKILEDMLKEVNLFVPPTETHVNFKTFMASQLTCTIDFDCNGRYHIDELISIERKLSNLDAKNLRIELIEKTNNELIYVQKNYAEELKRCEDSNEWALQILGCL